MSTLPSIDHIHMGTVTLHLRRPLPKHPKHADPVPADFFLRTCVESDDLLQSLETVLLDKNGGVVAVFDEQSTRQVVRVMLYMLPAERNSAWIRRGTEWSEAMGIVLAEAKMDDAIDVATGRSGPEGPVLRMSTPESEVNMKEVYDNLANPAEPAYLTDSNPAFHAIRNYQNPPGIKTELYRWQIRSLARMLRMEYAANRIPDPEYYPAFEHPSHGQCYINSRTWELRLEPSQLLLPKGGIQAEAIGSGKTLVCIALIISTLDMPSKLPPDVPPLDQWGKPTDFWIGTPTGRRTNHKVRIDVSQGTLVMVPDMIIHHWRDELEKHLPDGHGLRIYCLTKKLPTRRELINSDIVVLGRNFYYSAKQDQDLKSIFWKRIIIDEGSFTGDIAINDKITQLQGDSRWLVSGMLTDNMRQLGGVDVASRQTYLPENEDDDMSDGEDEMDLGDEDESEDLPCTKHDLDDLGKLENMIGIALGANRPGVEGFRYGLTSALQRPKGSSLYGVMYKIKGIMQGIIVKHKNGIAEEEASRTKNEIKHVQVMMDPLQLFAYNVFIAKIKLNALESGHLVRSRTSRERLLARLRLCTLWYAAPDMSIKGSIETANELILSSKSEEDDEEPDEDVKMQCNEIISHLERAFRSQQWHPYAQSIEVASPLIELEWTDDPALRAYCNIVHPKTELLLAEADNLVRARDLNRRGKSKVNMAESGEHYRKLKKERASAKVEDAVLRGWIEPSRKSASSRLRMMTLAQKKMEQKRLATERAQARKRLRGETKAGKEMREVDATDIPGLPRPLATKEIAMSCRSGKGAEVLRILRDSEEDDKFVIFGTNEELATLADLLHVRTVSFVVVSTSRQNMATRPHRLELFKSDASIKALLIEPVLGASGLHLVCANKVIFLSDCWTQHEMNQGIKRIYRNGQTRDTTAYILSTMDTFEDRSGKSYSKSLLRNWGERILKQPKFCLENTTNTHKFTVSLVPISSNIRDASFDSTTTITATIARPVDSTADHRAKLKQTRNAMVIETDIDVSTSDNDDPLDSIPSVNDEDQHFIPSDARKKDQTYIPMRSIDNAVASPAMTTTISHTVTISSPARPIASRLHAKRGQLRIINIDGTDDLFFKAQAGPSRMTKRDACPSHRHHESSDSATPKNSESLPCQTQHEPISSSIRMQAYPSPKYDVSTVLNASQLPTVRRRPAEDPETKGGRSNANHHSQSNTGPVPKKVRRDAFERPDSAKEVCDSTRQHTSTRPTTSGLNRSMSELKKVPRRSLDVKRDYQGEFGVGN